MRKTKNELYRTLDGAEPEGERYSELLEQCRIWNERDEYQKIIDALEAIPDQARTPETDSELARAYNNLADPGEPRGISMIRRALALLKPHEAYFEGDHVWNFRMGYSYYHLDQEGRGLFYFRRALEALPGDKDTEELIGCCASPCPVSGKISGSGHKKHGRPLRSRRRNCAVLWKKTGTMNGGKNSPASANKF